MIHVHVSARLHFGLLNIGAVHSWNNIDGAPLLAGRNFGGVGMMIDKPGIEVRVQSAGNWSASGPMAERALDFAHRLVSTVPDIVPQHIQIVTEVIPHVGLGTGTQLALAVAKAVAVSTGHGDWSSHELAWRVGRGERSAVGIHGFDCGGLIVEAGKRVGGVVSPLVARLEIPSEWRVLLVLPRAPAGRSGNPERKAFEQLSPHLKSHEVESLSRLVLLGMLPALAERDCQAFGEAVYDFNARVGELFTPVQGGRYASPLVGELVRFCRSRGVTGVGQSSWGPTIFAVVPDEQCAAQLNAELTRAYEADLSQTFVCSACNRGAVVAKG